MRALIDRLGTIPPAPHGIPFAPLPQSLGTCFGLFPRVASLHRIAVLQITFRMPLVSLAVPPQDYVKSHEAVSEQVYGLLTFLAQIRWLPIPHDLPLSSVMSIFYSRTSDSLSLPI